MKLDLSHYLPAGVNIKREKGVAIAALSAAALYSTGFLIRYSRANSRLYTHEDGEKLLQAGAYIENFADMLDGALLGFAVAVVCMLAIAGYHYRYHFIGSNSIYLMRRLPDKWELPRRCLTLPLAGILLCGLAAVVLLMIYYGVYMLFTPEQCIPPEQWRLLWIAVMGGTK